MEAVTTTGLLEMPTNADLAHILAQIDDLRAQMQADDAAIAELRAESAAFKAHGEMLREETRRSMANAYRVLNGA